MDHDHNLAEYIIEQASDAFIYADIHGNIQRWNSAACQLFGFSKTEVLGKNMNLIIPERARKAHWDGFNMAIQSGKLQLSGKPALTRVLHKNPDRRLYVEMSFALIKNEIGKVLGSVAIAREVERKE